MGHRRLFRLCFLTIVLSVASLGRLLPAVALSGEIELITPTRPAGGVNTNRQHP